MIKEFKKFISQGNVMDLAIGIVIGSAFTAIVTSLVNDIIMPLLGLVIGGIDFTSLSFTFKDATINYGMFIQNVVDFFIIAFCIFFVIRTLNRFSDFVKEEEKKLKKGKKEEIQEEEKEEVSEEIKLLREINENLKKQNKKSSK